MQALIIIIMSVILLEVIILMAMTFKIVFYFLGAEGFKKFYESKSSNLILIYTLGTPIIFIVYCVVAVIAIGILPHEVQSIVDVAKLTVITISIIVGVYLIYLFVNVWKEMKGRR